MLRVRFIGTSSGDYEFKPYDLIGEVNKNCTRATFFTINMSAPSIMNLKLMFCDNENFRNLIFLLIGILLYKIQCTVIFVTNENFEPFAWQNWVVKSLSLSGLQRGRVNLEQSRISRPVRVLLGPDGD